ncbi:hypothetical protein [Dactylosporangium sp. NPDC005555]|uniref:hypothetical protein n=1 Tax=Dactylosporangium sp. NPDC005555 TaxID=3154889 RepID=UPI00339F2AC2
MSRIQATVGSMTGASKAIGKISLGGRTAFLTSPYGTSDSLDQHLSAALATSCKTPGSAMLITAEQVSRHGIQIV